MDLNVPINVVPWCVVPLELAGKRNAGKKVIHGDIAAGVEPAVYQSQHQLMGKTFGAHLVRLSAAVDFAKQGVAASCIHDPVYLYTLFSGFRRNVLADRATVPGVQQLFIYAEFSRWMVVQRQVLQENGPNKSYRCEFITLEPKWARSSVVESQESGDLLKSFERHCRQIKMMGIPIKKIFCFDEICLFCARK